MKRSFLRLAVIVAAGCLPGAGLAAANPALPPCSKFPSGRFHVYPWTATLTNGVMSAALPSSDHYFYYFDFAVSEGDVQSDASTGGFSIVVPQTMTWLPHEYRLHLSGKAEHANGRYYFSGIYTFSKGTTASTARRRDTLEVVLSGQFCLDASR